MSEVRITGAMGLLLGVQAASRPRAVCLKTATPFLVKCVSSSLVILGYLQVSASSGCILVERACSFRATAWRENFPGKGRIRFAKLAPHSGSLLLPS